MPVRAILKISILLNFTDTDETIFIKLVKNHAFTQVYECDVPKQERSKRIFRIIRISKKD